MRFITIMGLLMIAAAINNEIVAKHSSFLSIIATIGLAADIIDFYEKNIRK